MLVNLSNNVQLMLSLENTKSEDKESATTEEEDEDEEGDGEDVEDNEDGKFIIILSINNYQFPKLSCK